MKRKAIPQRTRFRVFKRDEFKCCYCGRTPPAVILQVDHIHPVALGGDNAVGNLVTSCRECNSGKGAEPLTSVPEKLAEQMERAAEAESQLKAYRRVLAASRKREESDIEIIEDVLRSHFGRSFSPAFRRSIRTNFLPKFDAFTLGDFMEQACGRIDDPHNAVKYFCGICWKTMRERGL